MGETVAIDLEIAKLVGILYTFVWTAMAVSTSFIGILVLVNIDRLTAIKFWIRQATFSTFLLLILLNIPFGVFFANFFNVLQAHSLLGAPSGTLPHPFFQFGALSAQTGIVSHILFAVFFGLSWLAVESRAR
jgi:hypothetical protein